MLYTSDQTVETNLIRVLRKPFTGPQDSAVGDQLISLVESDIISAAAHRLADQIEVLVAELESQQAEMGPELESARQEVAEAERAAELAEQTFIQTYAVAAGAGQPVGEPAMTGRMQTQNKAQAARGRWRTLTDQARLLSNRHGLLTQLINELREITPPQPADIRAVIKNSRFWRG